MDIGVGGLMRAGGVRKWISSILRVTSRLKILFTDHYDPLIHIPVNFKNIIIPYII